jgi:cold shock CspA family protein
MALPVPLELSFREVQHRDELEQLVRKHAERLERFCDHIDSCRVAVERPHRHQGAGDEFRVRIDLRIAPSHELVVTQQSTEAAIDKVVRDAFHVAERRVKKLNAQQHGQVKLHAAQAMHGVIAKLFDSYGFISSNGREIYFHANSLVSAEFRELRVGMGVAWREEPGLDGPQATSVRVIDRRGHDLGPAP